MRDCEAVLSFESLQQFISIAGEFHSLQLVYSTSVITKGWRLVSSSSQYVNKQRGK